MALKFLSLAGRCVGLAVCALLFSGHHASAQNPLASRVLVVYLPNDPNSVSVANYYQSKRVIPAANMCPIPLGPGIGTVTASDYNTEVKIPVQNCLNNVGPEQILYIVLAYIATMNVYHPTLAYYYSLDSFLADVWDQYTTQFFYPAPTRAHPYYVANQSQGEVYTPFMSLAQYRSLSLPLIYSVWRLDGASPALATALVDNALAAEMAGGPISQTSGLNPDACIDMTVNPTLFPDAGLRSADWDLYRAAQFLQETNAFNVVTDMNSATFGTPPAPNCPNTALYAGWYNYDTYNNAFNWDAGSIGWDLDSDALYSIRSGPYWGATALQLGITVTSGPVAEPYLEGLARPSGVMLDLLEGANVGDAFLRNTQWLKWQITNVGDPLYTPFGGKLRPFNAPVSLYSLSINPRDIVGGGTQAAGLITLPGAASSTMMVTLSSSCPALSVPSSITIASGQTTGTFLVTTPAVTQEIDCVVTATTNSMSVSNTLSLFQLLSNLEFDQSSVSGGNSVGSAVLLNASAASGGITVQLSSDQPNVASVPASVTVAEGLSEVNFTVTTSSVSSNTTVNITASYAGATTTSQLTVTAP